MSLLMLRPDHMGGMFRRAVRNPKGEIKKMLIFKVNEPVELKGQELAAVEHDIGPALVEVELDAKKRPRIKSAKPEPNEQAEPDNPVQEKAVATPMV